MGVVAAVLEGALVVGVGTVVAGGAVVRFVGLAVTEAECRCCEEFPIQYPIPPATRATPMTRAATINDRLA